MSVVWFVPVALAADLALLIGVLGGAGYEVVQTVRARRRRRSLRTPAAPPAESSMWGARVHASELATFLRNRSGRSDDVAHAALLETIARSLRAGSSLTGAMQEALDELPADDATRDLATVVQSVQAGAPVVNALERWSSARSSDARVLAGTALVLGAEVGGLPARSLDAAAAGLRDRAALGREIRALSSQARASATVMVVGPVVFLALASAADARLPRVLFGSPTGFGCLAAGVALDAAGAWWMALMVRRVS